MDYAIGIYFDTDTEKTFTSIMEKMAQKGVNSYMLDIKLPPHITLSCIETDDINPVINAVRSYSEKLRGERLYWHSLASFIPKVLYAAPAYSGYLRKLNTEINELVKEISSPSNHKLYLPDYWVPHTALAVKMDSKELNNAFKTASEMFTAFGGFAERLFIAECEPFKEIAVWDLSLAK